MVEVSAAFGGVTFRGLPGFLAGRLDGVVVPEEGLLSELLMLFFYKSGTNKAYL